MKWLARELGFAFCDPEFAFILSGKLVRSEPQRFGNAEGVAHFHVTRTRVICKQHIADGSLLQFLVRGGFGGGVSGGAGRTGPLSAAIVSGLAPLRAVAVPMPALCPLCPERAAAGRLACHVCEKARPLVPAWDARAAWR
eukprot:3065519-Pleurochrysis_carterae.AAC.3